MSTVPLSAAFERFRAWYDDALANAKLRVPTAMTLATVDEHGQPSARVVLLKDYSERGFTFFTNVESHKGRELSHNPRCALLFHWDALKRQIRIHGTAERVDDEEAEAYFKTRPRESQIGAWASEQSRPLADRATLEERFALFAQRYPGEVPRPPYWSGYRVVPHELELWEEREFRLHHRELYQREGDGWRRSLLFP